MARINGHWLITDMVGANTALVALTVSRAEAFRDNARVRARPRDSPLVDVRRPAVTASGESAQSCLSRSSAPPCWSSRRSCSGCASSGSRTTGLERLGTLQKRASAYAELTNATYNVRLLLAENVPTDFYKVNNPVPLPSSERGAIAVNNAIANALARIGAKTSAEGLGSSLHRGRGCASRGSGLRLLALSTVIQQLIELDRTGVPVEETDDRSDTARNNSQAT